MKPSCIFVYSAAPREPDGHARVFGPKGPNGAREVSFRETTEAPVQDFQELPIFLKSVYRR